MNFSGEGLLSGKRVVDLILVIGCSQILEKQKYMALRRGEVG